MPSLLAVCVLRQQAWTLWSDLSDSSDSTLNRFVTQFGSVCLKCSQANLPILDCGDGNYSVYCGAPSKENWAASNQKAQTPNGFEAGVLKGDMGVAGSMISSWTFFGLVGGEITG